MSKLKNIPLYMQILIAMLVGLLVGYLFVATGHHVFVSHWIKPWGTIFIKLLKLIAVPLVFVSLLKGIIGMKDMLRLSRLGLKTISMYIATTIIAVSIGIASGLIVRPGAIFPADKTDELQAMYQDNVKNSASTAEAMKSRTVMDFVVDIVPENIFAATTDNSKMLQIIFVALLFGIALLAIEPVHANKITPAIDAVNQALLKVIDYIMVVAPIGVLALMAALVVDFDGDSGIFVALGAYALTVIFTLLLLVVVLYPLAYKLFTKQNPFHYLKNIFPIQLLAFSTSSSAATLPFTMEQSRKKLGIPDEVNSFVYPVGATINMDGTSCYQAISILFIAQIFGIELSMAQIISVIFLTVMASIGTPGIPGGSIVMTIMVMSTVGIPVEGMALIIGIDRPLDMLRTVVNVTGDTFVASVLDRKKDQLQSGFKEHA